MKPKRKMSSGGGSASGGKSRDLEFLFEIGSLRNIPRAWVQHLGVPVASNLEHMMRVVFLALLITRREGKGDESTIIRMALVHDLAETRTADLAYVHKVYADTHDLRAAHDLFSGTSFIDLEAIHTRYKKRDSIEAKIVKDADNLDIDLELKELEEQGHKLPTKWRAMRKFVRDKKLYTKTAKKIWDELQKANVARWHMEANKWKKIPSAGK
ncbi:HD domain-containing protein [Candidatus Kaiserbacteria bacterium]|nr:HD domain-containing protein [Candidatus Kaiserbacteria bacterium]